MTEPQTILLVEDDAIIALSEARMLRKAGYQVLQAACGEQAIAAVETACGAVDLILMDINLGQGMDGTQAAQEILKKYDIPIIFLSSHTEPAVVALTERITSYGYVVKNSGDTVLAASIKMTFKLHAAQCDLQRTNEKLSLAQEAGHAGTWDWDISQNTLDWSPEFLKLMGLPPDTRPDFDIWTQAVHPEDILSAAKNVHAAIVNHTELVDEYRVILPDGSIRWLRASGKTYQRGEQTVRMAGLCMDITQQKQAEAALRLKTEETEAFFFNALDLLCIADNEGHFVRLNQEWAQMLGYPLHELEGCRFLDFVHPDDLPATLATMSDLEARKAILNFTNRYRCRDGTYRWIEWRSTVQGDRIYAAARDISARKQAEETLHRQNTYLTVLQETTLDLLAQLDLDTLLKNIVRRAGTLVDAAGGYIALLDAHSGRIIPKVGQGLLADLFQYDLQAGQGVIGSVWQSRQVVVVNDYDHWPQRLAGYPQGVLSSLIGVPLLQEGRVMGVLGLGHGCDSRRTFDQNDVDILTQLARLAMLAIENANLFAAAHQELAERQATQAALQRALADKDVLMHELQHRVKNSLAIAASLLGLEQDNLPDERSRAIFTNMLSRFHSMAAVYEQLYRGGSGHIDLRQYIHSLVAGLSQSYIPPAGTVRIETELEAIQLDLKRTLPLGIILNELITNALKYAFPAQPRGHSEPNTIRVQLTHTNGQVTLWVIDNGVGMQSEAPGSSHMGLELVRLLTQQIEGCFTLSGSHGVTACVRFSAVQPED